MPIVRLPFRGQLAFIALLFTIKMILKLYAEKLNLALPK